MMSLLVVFTDTTDFEPEASKTFQTVIVHNL